LRHSGLGKVVPRLRHVEQHVSLSRRARPASIRHSSACLRYSSAFRIAGDQLRAIVERIEHVEDEIKELNEAKKEIYLEAKSNGFDVKVIREVVRLRKQDQKDRAEMDELLDVYLKAIKGASRVSKAA
jgi:uncharacterized protein (UPF0335 family)